MEYTWNAFYKERFEHWVLFAQKLHEKGAASGAPKAPPSIKSEQ